MLALCSEKRERDREIKLRNSIYPLLVLLILTSWTSLHAKPRWEKLFSKKGVVVSERPEKGRELPSFKGTGRVKGTLFEILAVLRDGSKRKEWMTRSGVTRDLKVTNSFAAISYQQTLAPWPVSDRDVVMKTQVYYQEEPKGIIATFDGVRWKQKIKGVDRDDFVLMPYLKGYWYLRYISDHETEVTYMVNTDPGGLLPNWLLSRISRDVPYYTLLGLRKQVKRSVGRYESFLNRFDPIRLKQPHPPKMNMLPAPPPRVLNYMK